MNLFVRLFFILALFAQPEMLKASIDICQDEIEFTFDNRKWKKDYEQKAQEAAIIEFTLENESVQNWSELVTIQKFIPLNIAVEDYYKEYLKLLKQSVNPSTVDSKILSQDENSIFFEWWIDDQGPNAQHEWFKLFKSPNAYYAFRYTTKKMDKIGKAGESWKKIISDSKLNPNASCLKKE